MNRIGPDRPVSDDWLEGENPSTRMERKLREQEAITYGEQCGSRYLRNGWVCATYQARATWTGVGIDCKELINDGYCPARRTEPKSLDIINPPTVEEENDSYLNAWDEYQARFSRGS